MTVKVAVIYYSATGTVRALAQAVAAGAIAAGAEVRLRHVAGTTGTAEEHLASVDDLGWADAIAFGTPTRFGAPAAQLKQFIDQTGELWREGGLADKPVTAFTATYNRHGGSEATILSLANVFYHWGALIVPTGYTDPVVYAAGGNPYGTSLATGSGSEAAALDAARYQGQRLTKITARLLAGADAVLS
ncbi:MAG TPA: NAD(P)H-dependent oxidoreductase [Streptosporangiaceae bacterium]|nr:NAD(P)H-dependent oxidoreductase [Streptosporangiaceae bacterium]